MLYSYPYGFNGQEKENDINQSVTSALYWFYDGRLGRRWNTDPKPTIGISEYAVFGNNPIWANDPLGDKLKISNKDNAKQEQQDIRDLAKGYGKDGKYMDDSKYISFDKDGNVGFTDEYKTMCVDDKKAMLEKNIGLKLVDDLVNAKDEKGKDLNFLYFVTDNYIGTSYENKNITKKISNLKGPENISYISKRIGLKEEEDIKLTEQVFYPEKGFQAMLLMPKGQFFAFQPNKNNQTYISRASVVYHELRENYYRTIFHLPYRVKSNTAEFSNPSSRGMYKGFDGAHNCSTQDECEFYGNQDYGGYYDIQK